MMFIAYPCLLGAVIMENNVPVQSDPDTLGGGI